MSSSKEFSELQRIAAQRTGGAFSNYWPRSVTGMTVPHSFHVSAGIGTMISVTGDIIQIQPPLRPGRSFSVRDVAGVIVGPSDGCNILYDRHNEMLARFALAEKNALVFVQYLYDHGVPFFRLNGEPLFLEGSEDGGHAVRPRRFVLELRRTFSIGMWIGLGMFLAMVLISVGFPVACCLSPQMVGPALMIVCCLSCASIVVPFVAAIWKGQLFPPQLVIEDEQMWLIRAFLPTRTLRMEEMGDLCFVQSDECYLLYDKKGKPLVKFSTRDDFGPAFLDFLREHEITLHFGH